MHSISLLSQNWIPFNGYRVRVFETDSPGNGHGGALFIHGSQEDGLSWQPMMRKLQSHLRCISVELPGHGASFGVRPRPFSVIEGARLIEAALGPRQLRPLILVGHEFGAAIAQAAALLFGDQASGLVLIRPREITEPASGRGIYESLAWKRQLKLAQTPVLKLSEPDAPAILEFFEALKQRPESNVRRFPWR
jgi:pimeloyl-ACP methyl ester carboxylesterase